MEAHRFKVAIKVRPREGYCSIVLSARVRTNGSGRSNQPSECHDDHPWIAFLQAVRSMIPDEAEALLVA